MIHMSVMKVKQISKCYRVRQLMFLSKAISPSFLLFKTKTMCYCICGSFRPTHQIHAKSTNLKSLKYSTFDSHIENRKFPKFQLHMLSIFNFMSISRIFSSGLENKM